jgi:hypothetical protein
MPSIKHPFEPDFLYQVDENGDIRVTNGNAWGVFTKEGIHLSGDIRHADPQLCVWVSNNPSADGQLRSAAVTAKRS